MDEIASTCEVTTPLIRLRMERACQSKKIGKRTEMEDVSADEDILIGSETY